MTAFSEAFAKAGIDTEAARLAVAANNILASAGMQPYKALARFTEILQTDNGLLRAIAADYLKQRAADMRGESLIGGGQIGDAKVGHVPPASADQSVGSDGSQSAAAMATTSVPPSFPQNADRRGHTTCAPAIHGVPPRSAPVHDGTDQRWCAWQSHPKVVRPVVKPPADPQPYRPKPVSQSAITARLRAAQMVATSVFDTYKVRGDIPIGDLGWGEAKVLARTNEREARVLRYITDHVANARPGALIREIVKSEVVENAIRLAAEADNVAA